MWVAEPMRVLASALPGKPLGISRSAWFAFSMTENFGSRATAAPEDVSFPRRIQRRLSEAVASFAPGALFAFSTKSGCAHDLDPAGATVNFQPRLVDAVEAVTCGDCVRSDMDILKLPPAVVAAAVDRRNQLAGQVDAAPVVVQFDLDLRIELLGGVVEIGMRHELVALAVPGIATRDIGTWPSSFAPADQRQAVVVIS